MALIVTKSTGTTAVNRPLTTAEIDSNFIGLNIGISNLSRLNNTGSGVLTQITNDVSTTNTANGIAVDATGKFVYIAIYSTGVVRQYSINQSTGALTQITPTISAGTNPWGIAADPTGRFVYVANYGAGTVSQYLINQSTGALSSAATNITAGTNPWGIAADPTGRFVYVANNGSATVSQYSINQSTGALTEITTAISCGAGPRGIAADPTGRFVYVANYSGTAGGTISQYLINQITGALTQITTPVPSYGNPYGLTVDPTGRFVYVANYNVNTITQYSINSGTGALTAITTAISTGNNPRDIKVDPSGKFVYVTNFTDNTIGQYSISQFTGALSLVGSPLTNIGSGASWLAIDPIGRFLYVVGATSASASQYSTNNFSATSGTISGTLNIAGTATSTSTNTGALQLAGGVGIGDNAYIGGTATATSFIGKLVDLTIKPATPASGITGGALNILGADFDANTGFRNSGKVNITGGTSNTTSSGGAVTINGGVATTTTNGGAVFINAGYSLNGRGGDVTINGGASNLGGGSNTGGSVYIYAGNSSTTGLTGNIQLSADDYSGTGCGSIILSTADNTSLNASRFILGRVSGLIPNAIKIDSFGTGTINNMTVGNETPALGSFTIVTITNTTTSTSTTTGALQVAGGAGIAGNIYVGGNIYGTIGKSLIDTVANNTITQSSSVTFSSDTPFGLQNSFFTGASGSYLTISQAIASQVSTGNLTLEFWFKPTTNDYGILFGFSGGTYGEFRVLKWDNASTGLILKYQSNNYTAGTNTTGGTTGAPFTLNAWNHAAFVRSGNNFYLYVNGTRYIIVNGIGSPDLAYWQYLGYGMDDYGGQYMSCPNTYFYNVKLTKSALYTDATYTIPTTPLGGGAMLIDVTTASLSGYTYKADQKFNSITATSCSFTNLTVSGTITNIVDGVNGIGYINIPQNSQSTAYTTVLSDAGKHIYHPATDANARTYIIAANSSVPYPIGTTIMFVNMTSQSVTISISTDTMYLGNVGSTGNRTLGQYGVATALKITANSWIITGTALS
jgi:YVTN family beta-propeller protein